MEITVKLLLLLAALVCFVLASFSVKGPPGGWQPVGLAFLALFFWP